MDKGETLTTRWLHEPRAISNHLAGLLSPHTTGRYRPGKCAFLFPLVGVVEMWANFVSRDILYSPGKAGSRRRTQGQHLQRLGFMSPGQSAITQWDWGFHTLRDGIDPEMGVFVSNSFGL